MKIFKRIIVWGLLSVIIQLSGLLYVNNYLLSTNTDEITSKKVDITTKQEEKNIDVVIPATAKHVSVSYDGGYTAYYEGEILHIINNKTGQNKEVNFKDGNKISFYKWLPDRNRMLITEKSQTKITDNLKLSYYDVDKGEKVEVKDLATVDNKSEVEDIKLSTLTNVIYVKVAHIGNRSSIYRINIMNEMKKIETKGYLIGSIYVIPHEDKMVYEDLTYNKIYATNTTEPLNFKNVTKPVLLGIDDDDRIYVGQMEGNKVIKIYYGLVKDATSNWKTVELKEAVDKEDIYISSEGKVYINDDLKGVITDITSSNTLTYQGRFLQMYEGGVATISQGKLIRTNFKK